MKRKLSGILFGLLFLIGFGILIYPTVADRGTLTARAV